MKIKAANLEQTAGLAGALAEILRPGMVIALNGDLGAGKTTFTRALARAAGVQAAVTSPTFALLNIYQGARLNFYHFDFYRLNSRDELENSGGQEFIPPPDGIAVIEWAEKIPDILPADYLSIHIAAADGEQRLFSFIFHGNTAYLAARLKNFSADMAASPPQGAGTYPQQSN
ncbi:MAG: tRNA (adenosine(37)-N6)-threonylcarbamoyltransferase complex ATPase subunit type 1 TsaE [Candidatus Margulisbacteria bacterium]|nr:tRNA (adenosine(37)-N6)-threonylcarbamoyltransferase complex ATPase subunit type 1 TsaE [Candidatus Margulisiibacteriota bacterium]